MFDYRKIEQQVKDYIPEEYMEDYDLDAMMDFIRAPARKNAENVSISA